MFVQWDNFKQLDLSVLIGFYGEILVLIRITNDLFDPDANEVFDFD